MVAAWVVTGEATAQQTGPSMDETKTWLESEGLDLMRARRVKSDNGTFTEVEDTIDSITLHNCVLSWRMTELIAVTVKGSAIRPSISTVDAAITLSEIGAGSIAVAPDSTFSDSRGVRGAVGHQANAVSHHHEHRQVERADGEYHAWQAPHGRGR